jgi:hypothetical protein
MFVRTDKTYGPTVAQFSYSDSPYPIRVDLKQAYESYWQILARPGNWWSGAKRVAIAAEVRNATGCTFCAERKQALSPYMLKGEHDHAGVLDPVAVDAVHRIITDQTRITENWIQQNIDKGLSEEAYIELLGIAVTVFSIDEANRGLGLPPEPLPEAKDGEPDHYRPPLTEHDTGFVAMIPADGATGKESDLWPVHTANVLRAMSLVPDAVRGWLLVGSAQYLSIQAMEQFSGDMGRALDRMQMELVAGRVSSINECFY